MADDDFDAEEADAPIGDIATGDGDAAPASDSAFAGIRDWLNRKRSWLLVIGLSLAMALFATIMAFLRSEAKSVAQEEIETVRALAVEMLGHEVKVGQIYQLMPMRAGKRMTVGLDMVVVLGQLPAEQVEGAPRPTSQEFEQFVAAVQNLEPGIRSEVNILLQRIPVEELGTIEAQKRIKEEVKEYINDRLDTLDFGKNLRPGIGKRRVTEVLLPMFVRQTM